MSDKPIYTAKERQAAFDRGWQEGQTMGFLPGFGAMAAITMLIVGYLMA